MMQKSPKYPALISDMYDVIYLALKPELPDDKLHIVTERILLVLLSNVIGGVSIYCPKADSVQRLIRDKDIYHQFNGNNTDELARRYKLSTRHIYNIVKEQRANHHLNRVINGN